MFRGSYPRSLDPKGRLMLPPEFRDKIRTSGDGAGDSEGRVILTFFGECVYGYRLPEWEQFERQFDEVENPLDPNVMGVQQVMLYSACEVEVDRQGRILVPPALRETAGLKKDVQIAGVIRRFEIWDAERFQARLNGAKVSFQDNLSNLAAKGVRIRL